MTSERSYAASGVTSQSLSSDAARDRQDVAYKLASYLLVAKSDKKAATIFSHTDSSLSSPRRVPPKLFMKGERRKSRKAALQLLRQQRKSEEPVESSLSETQQQQLSTIRQELAVVDQVYLDRKKDNFDWKDRSIILFKAKSAKLNGLSKEEKVEMYREAGFTDDEIFKITGKKLLLSAGISTSLSWISKGTLIGASSNEKLLPFLENIPSQYATLAVGASLLVNTAAYAYLTEKNLRLTKEFGGSTNSTVTGLYLAGNRLFPDKARDWLARGTPNVWNAIAYSGLYPLITAGVTESPTKIIAGSLVTASLNVIYAQGCEVFLRRRKKRGDRG